MTRLTHCAISKPFRLNFGTISLNLSKKDLEIVKKAYAAEELAVKKSGGKFKLSPLFLSSFEKLFALLENNKTVRSGEWSTGEVEMVNDKTSLITTKPIIYLANMTKGIFH
jgi:obg-like ATPase 1